MPKPSIYQLVLYINVLYWFCCVDAMAFGDDQALSQSAADRRVFLSRLIFFSSIN